MLGKLHVAGKSPEITCENAGNPRKIAADTRNSVGDATGKALSAGEIICETARISAKGKAQSSFHNLECNGSVLLIDLFDLQSPMLEGDI